MAPVRWNRFPSRARVGNGRLPEDIALTVHPHPTLSETLDECLLLYGHDAHVHQEKSGRVKIVLAVVLILRPRQQPEKNRGRAANEEDLIQLRALGGVVADVTEIPSRNRPRNLPSPL